MYFTQEDYKKIEKYLKLNSKKDSLFPPASLDLDGTEFFVIVQEGENRQMNLIDFIRLCKGDVIIIPPPVITQSGKNIRITAEIGTIYYTLDGSTPTVDSYLYTGEFTLTENTTIKAIAVHRGKTSTVTTYEFIIGQDGNVYYGYIPSTLTNFASRADAKLVNLTSTMIQEAVDLHKLLSTSRAIDSYTINSTTKYGYAIVAVPATSEFVAKQYEELNQSWIPFDEDDYNSNGAKRVIINNKEYKAFALYCPIIINNAVKIKTY